MFSCLHSYLKGTVYCGEVITLSYHIPDKLHYKFGN